jgi:hypothetical protein
MELDRKQQWLEELDRFIIHRQQETEILKEKQLDIAQCDEINYIFYSNSN